MYRLTLVGFLSLGIVRDCLSEIVHTYYQVGLGDKNKGKETVKRYEQRE